ncbi:MAG: efflux RND transporter periplasmic adaptor subunit [Lysobacterales bacterium]
MMYRVRKQLHYRGLITLLMAVVLLLLQGCMKPANGEEQEDETADALAIPVEAAPVSNRDMAAFYSGTATLEADKRATVVSQITGVVLKIDAEEADYVEAGQVLAVVEPERYALEVERTNASLKRLQTDYQRKKELYAKQLVSTEDFERVSAEYEAQKAAYELAKLDLAYTSIKAPISGYISERMVRVGNLVKLNEPVFNIISYDPLLAVLHVPERELRVLSDGLQVTMSVDAWPGETFDGKVIRISPMIDTNTGTFRVTTQVFDHGHMLKPGLFGRVEILYDLHADVPVIPRSAVITEDELSHVFVIDEAGNAKRRDIQLGFENDGMVEVTDGLAGGETVVTAGKGSLSDGMRVEVVGKGPVQDT